MVMGVAAEEFITRKQAAVLVGCSQATVRRAEDDSIRTKREPISGPNGKQHGSRVLLLRTDVDRWAAQRTAVRPSEQTAPVAPKASGSPVDGAVTASVLRQFRDGEHPVDVAIDLSLELTTVMELWRQYNEALLHEAPVSRLQRVEDSLAWLMQDAGDVPRDDNGARLDRSLPWLLAQVARLGDGMNAVCDDLERMQAALPGRPDGS